DLLPLRREGGDTQLDLVAALLLVIGDRLAQGCVLVLDEALREPHARGGRRGLGDVGGGEGVGLGQSQKSSEHRRRGEIGHSRRRSWLAKVDPSSRAVPERLY